MAIASVGFLEEHGEQCPMEIEWFIWECLVQLECDLVFFCVYEVVSIVQQCSKKVKDGMTRLLLLLGLAQSG